MLIIAEGGKIVKGNWHREVPKEAFPRAGGLWELIPPSL